MALLPWTICCRLPAAPAPLRDAYEITRAATQAAWLEAAAPKPGNVHPAASFDDLEFRDFVACAPALACALRPTPERSVGRSVLTGVQMTQAIVGNNVNLGIALLLAPLAAVAPRVAVAAGIEQVLSNLTPSDARDVYAAIRLANPGGLGSAPEGDVADGPLVDLRHAMRLAADRDLVARQYANGYFEVLHVLVPWLLESLTTGQDILTAIVTTQVRLLAREPDSLIARKCGLATAQEGSVRAQQALAVSPPHGPIEPRALADLDGWLRADGRRRNPGTTADLLAAALFVALRDGAIQADFYPASSSAANAAATAAL